MDLDADGNLDILSGSYSRMSQPMAGTFQILRGQAGGGFRKAAEVTGTDGAPLIIPNSGKEDDIVTSICTRPYAVDWDADGDLDLVVGNFAGTFFVFTGEGQGKFQPKPAKLMSGDAPLKLVGEYAMHSDPFVIDWDGDGDLDLLSGSSSGGVQWAENSAGKGKPPKLAAMRPLLPAAPASAAEAHPDRVTVPSSSTRVWAADVNKDGKLDLLVGDSVTLVSASEGVSEADFEKRLQAWQSEIDATQQRIATATPEQRGALYEQISELHQKRSAFAKLERTGFVWLYLRK